MKSTPFRRGLAALLVIQPVFWMSNTAYAQWAESPGAAAAAGGAVSVPTPIVPGNPETLQLQRGLTPGPEPVPPLEETIDPDRYVLGPSDVLELNFWGVQNFKLRVTVDVEGRAFVPKVGYFRLQGRTLTQARQEVRRAVIRLYPRLDFDLSLAEPRSFLVQVVDDVAHPGAVAARATQRVGAVIAKAGGFGPNASHRRIEIRRRDGQVLTADLVAYGRTGDLRYNPYLLDGDVVRVPFQEVTASIGGAVNRPGSYELVKTRDLAELLELAGGLAPNATPLLPVTLVRRGADDRQDLSLFPFAAGQPPALALRAEDEVRIPAVAELRQSVTVIGAISGAVLAESDRAATPESNAPVPHSTAPEEATATRRLPFVKGDTVRNLLERVGGVGPLADLQGAYIQRGGRTLPVDLYALVMLRDLRADRAIELGDTLVVPFRRRNVTVEGAVFSPGPYAFNPDYGVEQYLALAGGRNRNAQPLEDVKVVSPHGETRAYQPDLKVDPGSALVVPERSFSRSEVVQILIGAAGIVLSGVAVYVAARK